MSSQSAAAPVSPSVAPIVGTLADPIPTDSPVKVRALFEALARDCGIPYDLVYVRTYYSTFGYVVFAYNVDLPDGTILRAWLDDNTLVVMHMEHNGVQIDKVTVNAEAPQAIALAVLQAFVDESLREL